MFKRIVKLTFEPEKIDQFIAIFEEKKDKIRNAPGCHHLELWQSKQDPNVFFTYSIWEKETDLENYRHSDLFKNTWVETKKLFGGKPEAWSIDMLQVL